MPTIKINNIQITADPSDTILTAATQAGIYIPTMCWIKVCKPSTSCMVCIVKDSKSGKILPACSALVHDGMDIVTIDDEILDLRKTALELLLSEHQGDCEAPCQRVCPAEMDIPQMNRLIAEQKFDDAIAIVKQTIALPAVLGYICPAPCENACRRKDIDQAVSICLLKRFVAENDIQKGNTYIPIAKQKNNIKVAIIGSGPAGLSAAYYLSLQGFSCHIYDSNEQAGGALRTELKEDVLPAKVLDDEIEIIKSLQVEFSQNRTITDVEIREELSSKYPYILLTTGIEKHIEISTFEKTNYSATDEVTIYKVNESLLFASKTMVTKTKMAVCAVAVGRKLSEWISEYIEFQHIEKRLKPFNSVYNRISNEEQAEFLKEAKNKSARTSTSQKLQGFTIEQAVIEAQRCLHCDCRKKQDCVLRDLSTSYKANQRAYALPVNNTVVKHLEHQNIIFEDLKCIKCGICIQIAQKENDEIGFAFQGRGFGMQVSVPLKKSINELSINTATNCAKNCPTGALSLK